MVRADDLCSLNAEQASQVGLNYGGETYVLPQGLRTTRGRRWTRFAHINLCPKTSYSATVFLFLSQYSVWLFEAFDPRSRPLLRSLFHGMLYNRFGASGTSVPNKAYILKFDSGDT
jgi:hypothetical protein